MTFQRIDGRRVTGVWWIDGRWVTGGWWIERTLLIRDLVTLCKNLAV